MGFKPTTSRSWVVCSTGVLQPLPKLIYLYNINHLFPDIFSFLRQSSLERFQLDRKHRINFFSHSSDTTDGAKEKSRTNKCRTRKLQRPHLYKTEVADSTEFLNFVISRLHGPSNFKCLFPRS